MKQDIKRCQEKEQTFEQMIIFAVMNFFQNNINYGSNPQQQSNVQRNNAVNHTNSMSQMSA